MFFLCWEKDGRHDWEKCYKAKDIAATFVKSDLEMADKVYCLSGGHKAITLSHEDMLAAVRGELPIKGSFVHTPRFLSVMLEEVFASRENALVAGFTEPTHYKSDYFDVLGRSLGNNQMTFAAALKTKKD